MSENSFSSQNPSTTISNRSNLMSVRVAKIGIFAAVYVITSFFPLSVFVGFGSSFLTLALVMVPVMAILLRPEEAFPASLVGSFIAVWAVPPW